MPGPTRPKRKYAFGHPLTDEQLIALGQVAIEGADLESTLEWAIWKLLGIRHEIGELFTVRQNFETKLKSFKRVAEKAISDPILKQQARDIAARMRDSSGRRNDAIHSIWERRHGAGPGITPPVVIAETRKLNDRGAVSAPIVTDPDALRSIAADLHSDWIDLMSFVATARLDVSDGASKGSHVPDHEAP
jgi:hypothetical protein